MRELQYDQQALLFEMLTCHPQNMLLGDDYCKAQLVLSVWWNGKGQLRMVTE